MIGNESSAHLPAFTEHGANKKNIPLLGPGVGPYPLMQNWLKEHSRVTGRRARVLDLGCGRGATVAWLCASGYDAYGVDVDESYVSNGLAYFIREGLGDNRLRVVGQNGAYPFEDDTFDLIVSTDVIEHVEDLTLLARETARILRPGGRSFHIYPAAWRVVEAHMMTPIAHWFPKLCGRKVAIAVALSLGLGANVFTNYSLRERVDIFYKFSCTETFYRSIRSSRRTFAEFGLSFDALGPAKRRLDIEIPGRVKGLSTILAAVYARFFVVYAEIKSSEF